MVKLETRFKRIRQQILVPQPDLSISEWAEEHFVLSRESAAEPGKIHFSRTPYLREIVDTMGDISTERVVIMSSSQIGKTTALNCIMSYYVCEDPSPILFIQPTVDLAKAFSKERIAPLIRDMPILKDKMAEEKSRSGENTIQSKVFPGGTLNFIGANAPSQLASRPIRILLMDEVSRWPESAGDEGSPLKLAIRRTANFHNRKVLITSSPGIKGICHVEREFDKSDQRHYYVPCKNCGDFFTPTWANITWDSEGHIHQPKTARLQCPHCGEFHYDADRIAMVRAGEWMAKYPNRDVVGFHINAIISPWVKLHEMVTEWLDVQGSPESLKTFINTFLGETFDEEKYGLKGINNLDFQSRLEEYSPEVLPSKINFVTAGVDVQDDRLECSTYGYGFENEVWLIEHKVFHGSPSVGGVWTELSDHLRTVYRREDDVPLKIVCSCIDTGGHHTQQAYSFCNANTQRRWFAVKGSSMYGTPIFPKKVSKVGDQRQYKLYLLGVDTAKKQIYAWLQNEIPGEGFVHYPDTVDENFFEQLTAEKIKQKMSRGITHNVFILPKGKRNEALDCFVYSLAARYALSPNFRMIEIRNQKLVGKVEEMRRKASNEPTPPISEDTKQDTVNTQDNDSYQSDMLKKHLKRSRGGKRGGYVNNY